MPIPEFMKEPSLAQLRNTTRTFLVIALAFLLVGSSAFAGLGPLAALAAAEEGGDGGSGPDPWWNQWLSEFDLSGTKVDDRAEKLAADLIENGLEDEMVRVLISYGQYPDESHASHLESEYQAEIIHVFETIPTIGAAVPASLVSSLGDAPHVVAVEKDLKLDARLTVSTPSTQSLDFVGAGANTIYNGLTAEALGYTGEGRVIAILDTGVDKRHPAFPLTKIAGSAEVGAAAPVPCAATVDDFGHGTHVAHTALGDPSGDNRKGTAKSARLVDIDISRAGGSSTSLHFNMAMEFILLWNELIDLGVPPCPTATLQDRIDVGSLSFGNSSPGGTSAGSTGALIDQLAETGVVFVVSAGNCGPTGSGCSPAGHEHTVNFPANARGALAVAASNDRGTVTRADDTIAGFSSRGPNAGSGSNPTDQHLKPDITAPGVDINAGVPPGSPLWLLGFLGIACSSDGLEHASCSGTSMAAPHIAGIAALLIQAGHEVMDDTGGVNLMRPTGPGFGASGDYLMGEHPVRDALIHSADYRTAGTLQTMLDKWERQNSIGLQWNNAWGYGTVDAFGALCWAWENVLAPGGATPTPEVDGLCALSPVVVEIQAPETAVVGAPVTFCATITGGDAPYTVDWSFGDTTTVEDGGLCETHTYAQSGTFLVTATATDQVGRTGADEVLLTVSDTGSIPFVEIESPADEAGVRGLVEIRGSAGHLDNGDPSTPLSFAGLESATAVGSTAQLSWQAATGGQPPYEYLVFQGPPGQVDFGGPVQVTSSTETSVPGLPPDVETCFIVRVQDDTGATDTNTVEHCVTPQAVADTLRFHYHGGTLVDAGGTAPEGAMNVRGSMSTVPGSTPRAALTGGPVGFIATDATAEEVADAYPVSFVSDAIPATMTITGGVETIEDRENIAWTVANGARLRTCISGGLHGVFLADVYEVRPDGNVIHVLENDGRQFAGTDIIEHGPNGACVEHRLSYVSGVSHIFMPESQILVGLNPDVFLGSVATTIKWDGSGLHDSHLALDVSFVDAPALPFILDPEGDARSPETDITRVDVATTDTELVSVIQLADFPSPQGLAETPAASAVNTWNVVFTHGAFTYDYEVFTESDTVNVWSYEHGAYCEECTVTVDHADARITLRIPYAHFGGAPGDPLEGYHVQTYQGHWVEEDLYQADDRAPDVGSRSLSIPTAIAAATASPASLGDDGTLSLAPGTTATLHFHGDNLEEAGAGLPNVGNLGLFGAELLPEPPHGTTPVVHTGSLNLLPVVLTSPPLEHEVRLGDGNAGTVDKVDAHVHLASWTNVVFVNGLNAELNALTPTGTLQLSTLYTDDGPFPNQVPTLTTLPMELGKSTRTEWDGAQWTFDRQDLSGAPVNEDGDIVVPAGSRLQFVFWVQFINVGPAYSLFYDSALFDSRLVLPVSPLSPGEGDPGEPGEPGDPGQPDDPFPITFRLLDQDAPSSQPEGYGSMDLRNALLGTDGDVLALRFVVHDLDPAQPAPGSNTATWRFVFDHVDSQGDALSIFVNANGPVNPQFTAGVAWLDGNIWQVMAPQFPVTVDADRNTITTFVPFNAFQGAPGAPVATEGDVLFNTFLQSQMSVPGSPSPASLLVQLDRAPGSGFANEYVVEPGEEPDVPPAILGFSADPATGGAPLDVAFSVDVQAGTNDVDLVTVDPGDGTGPVPATKQNGVWTVQHTYQDTGSFTALAHVVDTEGLTADATTGVSVVRVESVTLTIGDGPVLRADDDSQAGDWSSWRLEHDFDQYPAGTQLTVRAVYFDGTQESEPHEITLTVLAPGDIRITAPGADTFHDPGTVTITGEVDDPAAGALVEVRVPGSLEDWEAATPTAAGGSFETWSFDWDASADRGAFTVEARLVEGGDVLAQDTQGLIVAAAPTAQLTATPETAPTGTQVTLDGSGSSDPDGSVVQWRFDPGDDSGLKIEDADATVHSYPVPGTYTAGLVVVNDLGRKSDPAFVVVEAENRPPVAVITAPEESKTVTPVSFRGDESFDPDGQVVSHEWDFGDGSDPVTGAVAEHAFASSGTYIVTLTVTDDLGATDAATHEIVVHNTPPKAVLSVDPSSDFTFTERTFDGSASFDPDGEITQYRFDFGDGSPVVTVDAPATPVLTHSYDEPGDYVATLTVVDDEGAENTDSRVVAVLNRLPEAVLEVTPNPTGVGVETVLDGSGSFDMDGEIVEYAFQAGDGSPPVTLTAGASVTHTYAALGTFNAALTVTDDHGDSASVSVPVHVGNIFNPDQGTWAVSLQDAVDRAEPGDTIVLGTGTYQGAVTIPPGLDGLTLCSAPAGAPDCADDAIHATVTGAGSSDPAIRVQSDDVTIRGIAVRAPAAAATGIDAAGTDGFSFLDGTVDVGTPESGTLAAVAELSGAEQADHLNDPFVRDLFDSGILAQITAYFGDGEGFLGAYPVTGDDPHVLLAYLGEAPTGVVAQAANETWPAIQIQNHTETQPLNRGPEDLTGDIILSADQATDIIPSQYEGIRPGARITGLGCSANWIWKTEDPVTGELRYWLGSAGHCIPGIAGQGGWRTSTTPIQVCVQNCDRRGVITDINIGAVFGPRVWVTLGISHGIDGGIGNDFSITEIPESAHHLVNASLAYWGGPQSGVVPSTGQPSVQFGHGQGSGDNFPYQGRPGVFALTSATSVTWYGVTSFGDSGSAIGRGALSTDRVLEGESAAGIVTHLMSVPPAAGGGTAIPRAVLLANALGGIPIQLVLEGETILPRLPPGPPQDLEVTDAGTGDALNLAWQEPTQGLASEYRVHRSVGPSAFGDKTIVGTTPFTLFQDAGLDEGTEYCYQIVAVDVGGRASGPSAEACGTPEELPTPPVPAPPFARVVDPKTGDSLSLVWGGPELPPGMVLDHYRIDRSVSGGPLEGIATVDAAADRVFKDDDVTLDASHAYRVIAVSTEGGQSPAALASGAPTPPSLDWTMAQKDASASAFAGGQGAILIPEVLATAGLGGPAATASPVVADVTGDGANEIITLRDMDDTDGDIVVTAHRLTGGSLEPVWATTIPRENPAGGPPTDAFGTLAVGDLDGDGQAEVVVYTNHFLDAVAVTGNAGKLTVLDGATGAIRATNAADIVIGEPHPPRLADITGDGALEIALVSFIGGADPGTRMQAFKLQGTSVVGLIIDTLVTSERVRAPPVVLDEAPGTSGPAFALADATGTIWVCRVTPDGSSWTAPCVQEADAGVTVSGLSAGTVEPTRWPSLVAHGRTQPALSVHALDPDGTTAAVDTGLPMWTAPGLADLAGTGLAQVASVASNELDTDTAQRGDLFLHGLEQGALQELAVLERDPGLLESAHAPGGAAVADITGDGSPEVILADKSGQLLAIRPDLAGLGPVPAWQVDLGAAVRAPLAVADATGDGRLEVIAVTEDGRLHVVGPEPELAGPIVQFGFVLNGASGATIADSLVTVHSHAPNADPDEEPVGYGVLAAAGAPGVTITGSEVTAGTAGIHLGAGSTQATVVDNLVTKTQTTSGDGVRVHGPEAVVEGNTVTGAGGASAGSGIVLGTGTHIAVVRDNAVSTWPDVGIDVEPGAGDTTLLEGNSISGVGGHGLSLAGSSGTLVRDNAFSATGSTVVSASGTTDARFEGNTFPAGVQEGIRGTGASGLQIVGNTFQGCIRCVEIDSDGAAGAGVTGVLVEDNAFTVQEGSTQSRAVTLTGTGLEIFHNTYAGPGRSTDTVGVLIRGGFDATVFGDVYDDVRYAVAYSQGPDGEQPDELVIRQSDFSEARYGVWLQADTQGVYVDARQNAWGVLHSLLIPNKIRDQGSGNEVNHSNSN